MQYVQFNTRMLIFIEGVSQKTIPNDISSCEVKIKKLNHKCFALKVSSVKVNMQSNKMVLTKDHFII